MENSVKESIVLLSELIQNKCVNPPGNEMKSIQTIHRFLLEHDVESQIFESAPNRGNLVARIPGKEKGPRLMFGPAHVDVVPVENPNDWEVDPFSGTVKDGYVWGRGALDMLYIVVTQVQAFIKLQKENFQPKGDLTLLVVSDEEAGGIYGAEWMLKNHPEQVKTDFLVTEAGGLSIAPGKLAFMIGEKGGAWKRISFKGTPGHGSMPFDSDNAAHKAARAMIMIREYCDSKIPLTTEYLNYLAKGLDLGFIQRLMLTNKRLLPFTLRNLKKRDPQMARVVHSLTRMTLSPNIVQGGTKVNVIPATSYIDVDIRTLPGQDDKYVGIHLKKALGDLSEEAKIESLSVEAGGFTSYGNASLASSEFVTAMEKAVQQEQPDSVLVPFIMPGVSDCRFFRERGVGAYGFSLFDPETPMSHLASLAHGTDERISIKTIEFSQRVYYNLAKIFLG
ncbi:MAG: M20/M25/M40 family metallo-hydrolase [Candidatus Heimdallarchaeota archaeon]|nr:MAG: M20/M25/M40 family metallo-hydrolase [Candidatus Heimdallarchaeota archaeon]